MNRLYHLPSIMKTEAFFIESGIYLSLKVGLRLEDIVVLRADGSEVFSELPRDVWVIAG